MRFALDEPLPVGDLLPFSIAPFARTARPVYGTLGLAILDATCGAEGNASKRVDEDVFALVPAGFAGCYDVLFGFFGFRCKVALNYYFFLYLIVFIIE
jgi:hypothetical protein